MFSNERRKCLENFLMEKKGRLNKRERETERKILKFRKLECEFGNREKSDKERNKEGI